MSKLKDEFAIALREIGEIEPWWSEENNMYVFEHSAYPFVMHADPDIEETRKGYLRALEGFVEERMNNNVADSVDRLTSGRGGARPGSGRPKGTKKEAKTRIYLPSEIVHWLQSDPSHVDQVRRLMG